MPAYQGVLLDIDGVLTVSWRPLPGAAEAVAALREDGYRLLFLTNTTSRTRQVLSQTLERAGFSIAAGEILTAASATATYLRDAHPGARCLLLSSGDVRSDFEGIDLVGPEEAADVVVIGGAGVEFSHDTLNQVFRLLREGVPLVAMHRNMFWQTGDKLTLDSGAYIAGLEQASGARATVIGKPSRAFFDQALAELGAPAAGTVVVGDDLEADVAGAKQRGMAAVLVRTGKYREEDLARSGIVPDAVLDSITGLPAWLRGRR